MSRVATIAFGEEEEKLDKSSLATSLCIKCQTFTAVGVGVSISGKDVLYDLATEDMIE